MVKARVISPEIYTYGAMVIGGILEEGGIKTTLKRELVAPPDERVMLSLYSTQHLMDEKIRSFVRQHREAGGRVIIGGPVSAAPDIVLGELKPDAVCVGEGESVACRLAAEDLTPEIPGVALLDENGAMQFSGPAPPSPVSRPLPLIPDDIGTQSIRGASAYIETHRGCTGGCTFCQVPRYFGRDIRSREIDEIIREAEAFRKKGATRLSVSGGTGSLYQYHDGRIDEEAFIELLKGLAGVMGPRNISAPDIRADCITPAILDAIAEYTIGWIFFGFESGSDRVLRLMGKGISRDAASEAVTECRAHGCKVAGSFIVGYPGEEEEDYEATKDFLTGNSLDDVFISIAEPIPATPLADLALRTPEEENPVFMPHMGEYKSLHLTEAEARSFDLQMHADLCRPTLQITTDEVFSAYLAGVRKDGEDVRRVMHLLRRYRG